MTDDIVRKLKRLERAMAVCIAVIIVTNAVIWIHLLLLALGANP